MTSAVVLPMSELRVEVDESHRRWRLGSPGFFAIWDENPDGDQGWKPLTGRISVEGRRNWPGRTTPTEPAWFCVVGERVPPDAVVRAVFANEDGEQVSGTITYVGRLFWAAEVSGGYPLLNLVIGATSRTLDLRPFHEQPHGDGWFHYEHSDRPN